MMLCEEEEEREHRRKLVLGSAISQKIRISEAVRNKFTCYLVIFALRLQALLVDLADESENPPVLNK